MAREDVGSDSMAATIMEKKGVGVSAASLKKVSPSKRSTKLRPERARSVRFGLTRPRRKIVSKSSPHLDEEEEESEPTLVHCKRKLPDQAS